MKSTLVSKIVKSESIDNSLLFETGARVYTFLNPVSYLSALAEKALFSRFDGIFADGSILVSAIKIVTSLAPALFRYAEDNGKSVYIVASRQEQVEAAVDVFISKYPGLTVAGYRNGYFESEEEQDWEAEHIVKSNPDFLIVGMGAIIQERFLLKVKDAGYKGIGFTCGGFIHQVSHNVADYYPRWVDRMNLRFAYRMYKEPHTRKRYLQAALLFPARFIAERFFG